MRWWAIMMTMKCVKYKRIQTDSLKIKAYEEFEPVNSVDTYLRGESESPEFVFIAPDIVLHPYGHHIHAQVSEKDDDAIIDVDLLMCYDSAQNSMILKMCKFALEGDKAGLTVSDVHKIPLERIAAAFPPPIFLYEEGSLSSETTPVGVGIAYEITDWESLLDNVPFSKLRAEGPSVNTLKWVARVYKVAQLLHQPPAKTVAERFQLPQRTASHWVKLMRERGADAGEIQGRKVVAPNYCLVQERPYEYVENKFRIVTGLESE